MNAVIHQSMTYIGALIIRLGSPYRGPYRFTWKIFEEEILNTQRDICGFSSAFCFKDHCSRAIMGGLTPFLLKKRLVQFNMELPILFWGFFNQVFRPL